MYSISLGDDGAELSPLEPWQAEEFLAHIDRGREFIGQHNGLPDLVTDLASSRAFLQAYADRTAADAGRIHGIRTSGTLVGAVIFRRWEIEQGTAEAGCWLEAGGRRQGAGDPGGADHHRLGRRGAGHPPGGVVGVRRERAQHRRRPCGSV